MKRWYTRDWMEYKEENDKQADSRSPTRQIQDALENAVHRQLMSDVPYGVLLSGGLDSSVISAIAKKYAASAESVQVIMEDAAFACCTLRAHRFPLYRLL